MGGKHGQQKAIDAVWLPSKALGSGPHLHMVQVQSSTPLHYRGEQQEATHLDGGAMPVRTILRPQVPFVILLDSQCARKFWLQHKVSGIPAHTLGASPAPHNS